MHIYKTSIKTDITGMQTDKTLYCFYNSCVRIYNSLMRIYKTTMHSEITAMYSNKTTNGLDTFLILVLYFFT